MINNGFHFRPVLLFLSITIILGCADGYYQIEKEPVEQISINRIESMPNLPGPYEMIDWAEIAVNFDNFVFNWDATGNYRPIIWKDPNRRNFDQETFGIYTAIGDIRQGTEGNPEGHEALGILGALISGTLMGIDKSNQDGYNYPLMVKNYFNKENGWNIIMNFTHKAGHIGGGYGNDWWYDLYNNVLFYALAHLYPTTDGYEEIIYTIAEQVCRADSVLGDNYSFSFFDFSTMTPGTNHIPAQEDVAAAHAYILYCAYIKFGEERFLMGAKNALQVLASQKESRFYEILMPFAAYVGARMNAEQNSDFDIRTFINWTFDGTATNREGWGVISERWGGYDVHGIVGSTIHNGGYGFLMNTFDLAWPLTSMLRYDQRYARAVGKWLLNAANASRLFYPQFIPDSLQALPHLKEVTGGCIAYEGLIKESTFEKFKGITPFAQGDGPNWYPGMPDETMFSVYGSAHAGFFGSIIRTTNIEGVLQINCSKTDFYASNENLLTYLYYNPHNDTKQIDINLGDEKIDVYDSVNRRFICRACAGVQTFELNSDQAALLILIPGTRAYRIIKNTLYAGNIPIDYLYD